MILRSTIFGLATAGLFAGGMALRAQPVPPPAAAASTTASAGNGLPDGPGRETLLRVCSGCHAPEVVAQQRHTEKDWHDLVELMAGNGAQGTDADFTQITAYLAKSFPAAGN